MRDMIVITSPLSLQVHLGNPKMARIPELNIRAMPEHEGGGWFMPTGQAEALVEAWNGFINSADEDAKELPTWAQLVAYWKNRAEQAERRGTHPDQTSPMSVGPEAFLED